MLTEKNLYLWNDLLKTWLVTVQQLISFKVLLGLIVDSFFYHAFRKKSIKCYRKIDNIMGNADIFADYICGFLNESINNWAFPSIYKIWKYNKFSENETQRDMNYDHVSIVPVTSKVSEKLLCKQ